MTSEPPLSEGKSLVERVGPRRPASPDRARGGLPSERSTPPTPVAEPAFAGDAPAYGGDPGPQPAAVDAAPTRGQATRGAAWMSLQSWIARLSGLVVFTLLGRLLEPEDFGLVAFANVFIMLLSVVVQRGVGSALIHHKAPTQAHLTSAFYSSIASGLACAGALSLAAPLLADVLDEPKLTNVLRWLSLSFVFISLQIVPTVVLTRAFAFRVLAMRSIVGALVGGSAGVVAAVLGAGAYALVLQTVVTWAAQSAMLWIGSSWRPSGRIARASLRELRGFSVKVFGLNIVGQVLEQMDKLLIGAFMGAVPLGVYTVAQRLQVTLQEATLAAVGNLAFPTFARLGDDLAAMRRALLRMCRVVSSVVLPLFGCVAVTAPDLIPAVFGDQWEGAVVPAQLLCGMAVMGTFTIYDRAVLLAVGKPGRELAIVCTAVPVNAAIFFATYQFGIAWVAFGFLMRSVGFYPIRVNIMTNAIGMSVLGFTSQWIRPLAAVGVAAGGTLLLKAALEDQGVDIWPRLLAQLAAFGVLYLFGLRVLSPRAFRETTELVTDLRSKAAA